MAAELARDNRLQAGWAGSPKKMSAVRALSIDLAQGGRIARSPWRAAESSRSEVTGKTTGRPSPRLPTDAYVVCYAQAWLQVSGAAQARGHCRVGL